MGPSWGAVVGTRIVSNVSLMLFTRLHIAKQSQWIGALLQTAYGNSTFVQNQLIR